MTEAKSFIAPCGGGNVSLAPAGQIKKTLLQKKKKKNVYFKECLIFIMD
jgi:hypothetical protein